MFKTLFYIKTSKKRMSLRGAKRRGNPDDVSEAMRHDDISSFANISDFYRAHSPPPRLPLAGNGRYLHRAAPLIPNPYEPKQKTIKKRERLQAFPLTALLLRLSATPSQLP